jgi:hypothetical protein
MMPVRDIFRVVGRAIGIMVADLINIFNLPMYLTALLRRNFFHALKLTLNFPEMGNH